LKLLVNHRRARRLSALACLGLGWLLARQLVGGAEILNQYRFARSGLMHGGQESEKISI